MSKFNLLPDNLEIKPSTIHGVGLFASKTIPADTDLGISHCEFPSKDHVPNDIMRNAIGGAINHSYEPNCELIELNLYTGPFSDHSYKITKYWVLKTVPELQKNTELTLDYTQFPCGENQPFLEKDGEKKICSKD